MSWQQWFGGTCWIATFQRNYWQKSVFAESGWWSHSIMGSRPDRCFCQHALMIMCYLCQRSSATPEYFRTGCNVQEFNIRLWIQRLITFMHIAVVGSASTVTVLMYSVLTAPWHWVLALSTAAPVGVVNTALCSSSCSCAIDGILRILSHWRRTDLLHTRSGQWPRCLVSDSRVGWPVQLADPFSNSSAFSVVAITGAFPAE